MSRTAKDVFLDALDIADTMQRDSFVDAQTAGNAKLRAAVNALLSAHAGSPTFAPPRVDSTLINARAGLPRRSVADAEAGDVIDGSYTLIRPLGEGGFGVVWLARQFRPVVRDVALKLLRGGGLDSGHIAARFESERQTLARMEHPNIARVFDAGTTASGLPYFVMEYIDGPTITHYAETSGLTLNGRLELLRDVCLAVQHAHLKGVIHRDLKPGNLLICMIDGQPVPKVIDFGIAKAVAEDDDADAMRPSITLEAQVIGTPQYMSPEQATIGPKSVDTRSDVYSLGTVLYELITGTPPFDPAELRRVGLEQICKIVRERTPSKPSTRLAEPIASDSTGGKPPELTRLRRQVIGEVDWIVMKALEKDPARRYQSAEGLAADIDRFLSHEPVLAGAPSKLYAFRKFVRRRRLEVATAAIVSTALVVVTAVSIVQRKQAQVAEQVARSARADAERATRGERDAKLAAQASELLAISRADDVARELSKSKSMADFAQSMFSGLSADVARGRDTALLREMLQKATERADENLADKPDSDLIVRKLIAQAQADLGDYATAIATLRERFDTSRDTKMRDSYDRLAIGLLLGELYNLTDQTELAAQVTREVYASYQRLNDATSNLSLQAQAAYGTVLLHEGKTEEALAAFRKTLDELRALGRGETGAAMTVWNSIAFALMSLNRSDEARREWEAQLDVSRRVFGEDDQATLSTMTNLAVIYSNSDAFEKALQFDEHVAQVSRRIYEPGHPARMTNLINYVGDLLRARQLDRAQIILDEALDLLRRNPVGVGWKGAAFVHHLAMELCVAQGKYDAAVDHARAERDAYAAQFPPSDPHTLRGQTFLMQALVDADRIAEAQALADQIGRDPWPGGADADHVMDFHGVRARIFLAAGRPDDANAEIELGKKSAPSDGRRYLMSPRLRRAAIELRDARDAPATHPVATATAPAQQ